MPYFKLNQLNKQIKKKNPLDKVNYYDQRMCINI